MRSRPRRLHDFFTGQPHPMLQREHQPADPHVLASVHRAIREETPDLVIGEQYRLEGEVHEYAYFNLHADTPEGGRRVERVGATFVGAWWDHSGASAIFRTQDAAGVYFRVPLSRLRSGSVSVEGPGLRWPPPGREGGAG